VRAGAVTRDFAPGETLFTAGSEASGLLVILEGRVQVTRAGGTRAHLIHDGVPGDTLGDVPMFEGRTYPATATAVEPTRCLVIVREGLHAAIRAHPEVAFVLLARLAGRVRLLVERLDSRTARAPLQRLAALLLLRHEAAAGASFILARTQQAAAEELGTVREVVVRGLRALRDDGVIRAAGGGRYAVVDERALRAIAQG
jgi:CRP/FNR family transcriptional regulator